MKQCDLPVFNQFKLAGKGIIVFALLLVKHPHNLILKKLNELYLCLRIFLFFLNCLPWEEFAESRFFLKDGNVEVPNSESKSCSNSSLIECSPAEKYLSRSVLVEDGGLYTGLSSSKLWIGVIYKQRITPLLYTPSTPVNFKGKVLMHSLSGVFKCHCS